jgi:branched-chain amino acid transport system ATP-binding protein
MDAALHRPATEVVLRARGLRKDFRGYSAVSDVNLDVHRGDIHALIGPNGAGKTTVFNLLTKFMTPTAGQILLDGVNVTRERPAALARRGLVRSFQISAVFSQLTVSENIVVALQRSCVSPVAFWRGRRQLGDVSGRVEELLEQVDLTRFASHRAGDLAYGRKRALELATTLAAEPKIMLLDEPTQGLGHEDVDRVTALIKQAAAGRTVVMVEHNMKMVASIADRISVLRRGSIIAEGQYDEVSRNPEVIESYLGSPSRREKKRS